MNHLSRMGMVTMRLRVIGIRWGFTDKRKNVDSRVWYLRNRMRRYALSQEFPRWFAHYHAWFDVDPNADATV